jgi:RNA polymerase sigma-70 factor (ECF subfamily)
MDAALAAKLAPDDIVQEVYLDVVRQIDRFENRGLASFLSWVYAILDHKIIDARRALHCQARDIDREQPAGMGGADSYWDLLNHVYAQSGTPSRVVRRQESLSALLACLPELSESYLQVIQLRFIEGLSVGETAGRLNKSEAAVVSMTRRALDALRTAMDGLGEFTRGG